MNLGPDLDPEAYAVKAFPAERPLPEPRLCGKGDSSVEPALCSLPLRCATSFAPRVGPQPLDLAVEDGAKGWQAALAPGEGDNAAACTGHLDQKYNTLASAGADWLTMRVSVARGLMLVCEGPFNARFKAAVEYVNTSTVGGNAQLLLDGSLAHYRRKLPKSLCSVVADDLAPGDHTLALRPTAKVLTGFSHLIWA